MLDKSVERQLPVRKGGNSIPTLMKPLIDQIDTCCYLAWHSALLGEGKNWLAHFQDNVTEVMSVVASSASGAAL